jgi:glycerol-3-phosphate acyltransferase PlsY
MPYLALLFSYLAGAVPFAYLAVRFAKGEDLRKIGSGNVGATNAARALGNRSAGLAIFALDVGKGFLPAWLCLKEIAPILPGWTAQNSAIAHGAAAFCGHCWPVYLGFRGGKGVATGFGMMLALVPVEALLALATWGCFAFLFRYVSLASSAAAGSLPLWFLLRKGFHGEQGWILYLLTATAALVVLRHRSNLGRLLAGTEPKMGKRT